MKKKFVQPGFPLLLTIGVLLFFSCKKEIQRTDSFVNLQQEMSAGPAVQLQVLKNPYSVANMAQAYAALKTKGDIAKAKQVSPIKATHYYIKFTPTDDREAWLLKKDSTLNLYSYPLDVAMPDKFDVGAYHAQQEAIGAKEVYYASIPVGYSLPKIHYEILEQLFIPDDYSDNNAKARAARSSVSDVGVEALVAQSFELTGNKQESTGSHTAVRAVYSTWRPAGRIRAWDKTMQVYVPVEGLKVRAKRWFTTHTGFTGANGNFECDGSFERPADYSFDWERYEFAIRDGDFSTAGEGANNIRGNWNPDYDATTLSIYHAAIFRAAFHYAYQDILGLRRPPENGTLQTQLKYRANPGTAPGGVLGLHAPGRRFLGLGSAIQIYDRDRPTDWIYGTTIHETAHAAHWNMCASDYNNSEDYVSESWARGVEWALTSMVYPNYIMYYYRTSYTGVVQDLIDGIGTTQTSTAYYNGHFNYISYNFPDNVEGYTIRQLEDALNGQRTKVEWRNSIITRYDNPTKDNVLDLFINWDILTP